MSSKDTSRQNRSPVSGSVLENSSMVSSSSEITRKTIDFSRGQQVQLKADSHVAVYQYEYDQWSYLHKSIIFLVILIFNHVLFRLMQKHLTLVINCLLFCTNWYSSDVIRSSYPIRTRSHRIRTVVKFYNYKLWLRNGCIWMRHYPPSAIF